METLQFLPYKYTHLQGHRQFVYYTTFQHSTVQQIEEALNLSRTNKLKWAAKMMKGRIAMNVLHECMMATTATEFLQYHISDSIHIQFCFMNGRRLGINLSPHEGICNNCDRRCTSASDYVFCDKCSMPRGCTACASSRVHLQQHCNAAQQVAPSMLQYIKPMGNEPF